MVWDCSLRCCTDFVQQPALSCSLSPGQVCKVCTNKRLFQPKLSYVQPCLDAHGDDLLKTMKEGGLRYLIQKSPIIQNIFLYPLSLCWQHSVCLLLPLWCLHRVMRCFIRSLVSPNKKSFPCRWLCFPTQFRQCFHFRNTTQARLSYFFIFLFQGCCVQKAVIGITCSLTCWV